LGGSVSELDIPPPGADI